MKPALTIDEKYKLIAELYNDMSALLDGKDAQCVFVALSMTLSHGATDLGMDKETLLTEVGKMYDTTAVVDAGNAPTSGGLH